MSVNQAISSARAAGLVHWICLTLATIVGGNTSALAQAGARPLAPFASLLMESRPRHAVVLPSGELLLTDGSRVFAITPRLTTLDTIGRTGDGPGEYRRPIAVGALSGGRVGALTASGRLVSWRKDGTDPVTVAELGTGLLSARFDSGGNALAWTRGGLRPVDGQPFVLLPIVGFPRNGSPDTLFRARRATTVSISDDLVTVPLYAPADAWGLTIGGLIWVLRAETFRLESRPWAARNWSIGAPIPWQPVRTSTADRRRFVGLPGLDTLWQPMVDIKAPFAEAVASSSGAVFTRLHSPAGSPIERVRIVNQGGARAELRLPKGTELLAVGLGTLYTIREDADGFTVVEAFHTPR